MWLHRNYRPKPFSSCSKQGKNVSIGKHINRPFILVSVLGEGNFLRCYLNKAIQGLVFSSLISTMLVLVRLKLEHESSRIHFRGLSVLRVYEEGRRRRKVFAKGFPPYSMLLAAPSKNLEHALSQMSSTKRYMSRIQNFFRCVHNAIWCDCLCICLMDNQQNGAWTMCILDSIWMFVKGVVKVLIPAFLVTL